MHQIAKLLELPGSVGPPCPSPTPAINLHSLRQTSAAARRSRNKGSCQNQPSAPSISSKIKTLKDTKSSGGSAGLLVQRPLFSGAGKFPGSAAFGSGRQSHHHESGTSSRVDTEDEDDDNDNDTRYFVKMT